MRWAAAVMVLVGCVDGAPALSVGGGLERERVAPEPVLSVPMQTLWSPDVVKNDGDKFGWTIESLGDRNGDGFDDLLVGTLWELERTYVFAGASGGFDPAPTTAVDGWFGFAPTVVGDIDGDGCEDVFLSNHDGGLF